MSDTVTILTSSTGHCLSKGFIGESYVPDKFNPGTTFTSSEVIVKDLEGLAAVLRSLEASLTKTIIRGSSISGAPGLVNRTKDQFKPAMHNWCMIDIDGLAWDGTNDPSAMVHHAINQLPPEFMGVDCYYQFSASMGIKTGIRIHLWFWLDRPCSDDELRAWLHGCPVDLRMYDPIQIHLTANPRFIDGANDPLPNRSGHFIAKGDQTVVVVPNDLTERTEYLQVLTKPKAQSKSGLLDPNETIRDPHTGLAIDGREQLMFKLSNQVMMDLVTSDHQPSEEEITNELWDRFRAVTDLSIVSDRGPWTINDAQSKAKARLRELQTGTYEFVSRSDRTTLVAGNPAIRRPKLLSLQKAQEELETILGNFFINLNQGKRPRSTIQITMGTGKTTQTISHLKSYLSDKHNKTIEVYVPRHDLAHDWEEDLIGVNAKVVHVYPRTGGQWNEDRRSYDHPIMCERADYVRDLEAKGHSIYGNACLSRNSGEQCQFFNSCAYLDQFRETGDDLGVENIVRIYSHASLFLPRNEYERRATPDLVIVDEAFLSAAVSNIPRVLVSDVIQQVRLQDNDQLGFELVECLSRHGGDLSYLRDKGIDAFEFEAVSLDVLRPSTGFNANLSTSLNVRSVQKYKSLTKLLEITTQEIGNLAQDRFVQLAYNEGKNEIFVCEHKHSRITRSTPMLYLDATADPIITEAYFPGLTHHRIDVYQLAVVNQVHDRTGSNSFWNNHAQKERQNLSQQVYAPNNNDLSALIVILNKWVEAGEQPLVVGHKEICDLLREHPQLDQSVAVAHFNSLRGSNEYKDKSVIFITGRNQPPMDDIERQARAIFGTSDTELRTDDLNNLPIDQIDYWLSDRSSHSSSAISLATFSDPRIAAVQKQIREAETIQAIARLRLVRAEYQKRVFLLSNLPVEMPVDHLIEFDHIMPDRLEFELLKLGNLPLTPLGVEKMRSDLGLTKEAIKKLMQRSKSTNPKRLLLHLPNLVRTSVQIATFKAGDKRKTTHQHLFLPKDYSGSPTVSLYTPWTDAEVLAHLEQGWGVDAITDLQLEYLYGPEPEFSG